MKHQAFFSSKDISKKIKVLSAAILLGALMVKEVESRIESSSTHKIKCSNIFC